MTALLLDTHVALWLLMDAPLSEDARTAVAAPVNAVFLSIVSAWEVAIKQGRGTLEVQDDYLDLLAGQGVKLLAIRPEHTRTVRDLPHHHRDPFDRMLVAQAQVERLTLVTRDERLGQYDVRVLAA